MKINNISAYKGSSPIPQNQQKVSFKRDGGCTIAGGPSSDEFLKNCGVADDDRRVFIKDPVVVVYHDNEKAWLYIDETSESFHPKYKTIGMKIADLTKNIQDPKEAALSAENLRRVRASAADNKPKVKCKSDSEPEVQPGMWRLDYPWW